MGWILVLLLVFGVVGFLLFAMAQKSKTLDTKKQLFKSKLLLTPNELEFLARLELAAPEIRFCPQVCMGAILDPAVSKKDDAKLFMSIRGRFAQKIIDFVAQERASGAIVAIIELDDRTHSLEKDKARDAMLNEAGYRVIRWQSKNKPTIEEIRKELFKI